MQRQDFSHPHQTTIAVQTFSTANKKVTIIQQCANEAYSLAKQLTTVTSNKELNDIRNTYLTTLRHIKANEDFLQEVTDHWDKTIANNTDSSSGDIHRGYIIAFNKSIKSELANHMSLVKKAAEIFQVNIKKLESTLENHPAAENKINKKTASNEILNDAAATPLTTNMKYQGIFCSRTSSDSCSSSSSESNRSISPQTPHK